MLGSSNVLAPPLLDNGGSMTDAGSARCKQQRPEDARRARLDALYQAAVRADQNGKLSIFATRPAIPSVFFNWVVVGACPLPWHALRAAPCRDALACSCTAGRVLRPIAQTMACEPPNVGHMGGDSLPHLPDAYDGPVLLPQVIVLMRLPARAANPIAAATDTTPFRDTAHIVMRCAVA